MSTTITGHLIQDPHPTDESRVVSVDPNARTGRFRTIQHAVDYVRSRASAANPYIIRLMPGIYSQDVSIDASSMAGVQWVGAGRSSTVIYGDRKSVV